MQPKIQFHCVLLISKHHIIVDTIVLPTIYIYICVYICTKDKKIDISLLVFSIF